MGGTPAEMIVRTRTRRVQGVQKSMQVGCKRRVQGIQNSMQVGCKYTCAAVGGTRTPTRTRAHTPGMMVSARCEKGSGVYDLVISSKTFV